MLLPFALIAFSLIATGAAKTPVKILNDIESLTVNESFTLKYTGCDGGHCSLFIRGIDPKAPLRCLKTVSGDSYTGTIEEGSRNPAFIPEKITYDPGWYFFQLSRWPDGAMSWTSDFLLREEDPEASSTTEPADLKRRDDDVSPTWLDAGPVHKKLPGSYSGMSASEITGIVVASFAGAFLVLLGLGYWIFSRRRARATARTNHRMTGTSGDDSVELADREKNPEALAMELPREPAPPYSRFPAESTSP